MTSEPREFWLFSEGKGTKDPDYQMLKPDDSLISEFIHVIEYSAYEKLQAENEKLKAALEKCKEMRNDPPNPWDFYGDDYAKELARQDAVLDDILRENK